MPRTDAVDSLAGVRVDLIGQDIEGVGRGFGGDAEGDRLISIENIIGSAGDDWLRGSGGDNVLTGGDGSDTFVFNRWSGYDTVMEVR